MRYDTAWRMLVGASFEQQSLLALVLNKRILAAMHGQYPRKHAKHLNQPGHAHELTFSCYRQMPLLNRPRTRQWMLDALAMARERFDLHLWAYVIMPEHVHILLLPQRDPYDIAAMLKAIKLSVARKATNWLRSNAPSFLEELVASRPGGRVEYRFWQQGPGYDRNVTEPAAAWSMVDYLHENPVRRGLVSSAVDWPWSSARQYAGLDGVLLAMNGCPPDRA